MPEPLYAHTKADRQRDEWERLEDHLREVAAMAAGFAAPFGCGDLGRSLGLLHDVGKASAAFQAYLEADGKGRKVDHSTAGAQVANDRYKPVGKLLAFALAGHHAGLADGAGGEGSSLERRLSKTVEDFGRWRDLGLDLPERFDLPALDVRADRQGFQCAFLVRMLFSALVDADRLCSERFDKEREREAWPELPDLKPRFDAHTRRLAAAAERKPSPVNTQRELILKHALGKAELEPGLFTLSVPTGGGKTLTSTAWALAHARAHGLRRLLHVIPFTSVVEQTAGVLREAFGPNAVLEHHSAFDADKAFASAHDKAAAVHEASGSGDDEDADGRDRHAQAAENWDAPVVVTTAVQFFESLFAARTGRCRKLHNLAKSVIVLDEAQTLPLPLLLPCVAAIDELCRNYGCSVVLMTATQPALSDQDLKGGLELKHERELAPDDLDKQPAFRRVRVTREPGPLDDDALAERLLAHRQALCVVNSRRHARELYERLKGEGDAHHLSTLMHAKHRRSKLDEIRERLKLQKPVRLVSTSLIEAGVDISFPTVFRASAGLDQVAQAAGRCNREGELGEAGGEVVVFEAADHDPPTEIKQRAGAATGVLRSGLDPLSQDAVTAFFRQLYRIKADKAEDAADAKKIIKAFNEQGRSLDFPFATVAGLFRMIDDVMVPVIVPGDAEAEKLVDALRHAERVGGILRRLQPYTVQVPARARGELLSKGAAEKVRDDDYPGQFVALTNPHLYRDDVGLTWDDPTFLEAQKLVL